MLSVVIATYQREERLGLCLAALVTQRPKEVVVIDDGGTDKSLEVVRRWATQMPIKYVWHPHDRFGLSQSRNEGAALARGDLLVFIDSDILLNPNALEAYTRLYEQYPNCAVAGYYKYLPGMEMSTAHVAYMWDRVWNMKLPRLDIPQKYKPIGKDVREAWHNVGPDRKEHIGADLFQEEGFLSASPFMLLGGNMAIPRHIFNETGGFDENFRQYGGEDAEMSLAILSAGYGIRYSKAAAGAHMAHEIHAEVREGENEIDARAYIAKKYPAWFINGEPAWDGRFEGKIDWEYPVREKKYK